MSDQAPNEQTPNLDREIADLVALARRVEALPCTPQRPNRPQTIQTKALARAGELHACLLELRGTGRTEQDHADALWFGARRGFVRTAPPER